MKTKTDIQTSANSKGAAIFKKMLDDKKAIHDHIQKGGKISEIKENYNFVKPIPTTEK